MVLKKRLVGVFVLVGLLIGSLAAGAIMTGNPGTAAAAPSAQTGADCVEDDDSLETAETEDLDDVEEENECGVQDENEADDDGEDNDGVDNDVDEADEVAPAGTGISADDARNIALEAFPDATVLEIEFDREGGVDLFEAELADGTDVKIDANSGEILGVEARD